VHFFWSDDRCSGRLIAGGVFKQGHRMRSSAFLMRIICYHFPPKRMQWKCERKALSMGLPLFYHISQVAAEVFSFLPMDLARFHLPGSSTARLEQHRVQKASCKTKSVQSCSSLSSHHPLRSSVECYKMLTIMLHRILSHFALADPAFKV